MKKFLITLMLHLVFIGLYSQSYISNKQSFNRDYSKDYIDYIGERIIVIKGNIIEIDLPNAENSKFIGKVNKKSETKNSYGVTGTVYYFEGGGLIVVYPDQIYANLSATFVKGGIQYFLPNYIEPTAEQKKEADRIAKIETEKSKYDIDVKIYGKFTADCIRDQEIRAGMKEAALILIDSNIWEKINKIVTSSGVRKQYVYPNNKYVYVENGIVTAIQTEEKL